MPTTTTTQVQKTGARFAEGDGKKIKAADKNAKKPHPAAVRKGNAKPGAPPNKGGGDQGDEEDVHEIRRVSFLEAQKFKIGPEYIDEEYFECTPVPLYGPTHPIFDYDEYLDHSTHGLMEGDVPPPKEPEAEESSALFDVYQAQGPPVQRFEPNLTDLEEDCFFQEVIAFPTSKLAHTLPREKRRDLVKKRRVKIFKPSGDYAVKTRIYIDLEETSTIFLLEIPGTIAVEAAPNFEQYLRSNEAYEEVVQRHIFYPDSFADNSSQTFENYRVNAYTDYKIQGCYDIGTECHSHYIDDEYKRVAIDDAKRLIKDEDELTALLLAEKARKYIPELAYVSDEEDLSKYRVEDDDDDDARNELMNDASEDELPMSSEEDDEFEIRMPLRAVYERKRRHAKQHGIRVYPDISFSLIALERIMSMDVEQEKQADMRGFLVEEVLKPIIITPVEEEGPTEVLNEDEMVDYLIQQHRMQEEMEKEETGEKGEKEPGEITEADILRMEAELVADEEAWAQEEEAARDEALLDAAELSGVDVEKDIFDLLLEGKEPTPSLMDPSEALLLEEEQDTEKVEGLPVDDLQGSSDDIPGALISKWNTAAETDFDVRLDAAQACEEVIPEEKLDLPPASMEDEIPVDLPRVPADPTAVLIEKKEMFDALQPEFPDLIQESIEPTPEEIMAAKLAALDAQDDISIPSEGDLDSNLSDHQVMDEDVEDSSDVLSDDGGKVEEKGRRTSTDNRGLKGMKSMHDPYKGDRQYLKEFWQFRDKNTHNREITDIAIHPLIGNIMAAAYGTNRFGKDAEPGYVCVWNAKNSRTPERFYTLKSPVTAVAFAEFTPYVLAVGLLDGNIILFDIREDDGMILASTYMNEDRHLGPVWQIYFWISDDPSAESGISEIMLTLGDDGFLKKWNISKGKSSSQEMMKVMRSTLQIPGRREKRNESLISTLSNAYTICFYPDNPENLLLGTEEGFIHKCATGYKDQYFMTFIGHTGPVYRICFSPFDDTIFISCGGDWTIRFWKTENTSPVLTLNTGLRTIFDVSPSPFSSTVFVSCAELHVEVWDLTVNTLEPVIQQKVISGPGHEAGIAGMRKVAFNHVLNSAIVGDDEGGLHLYGLRNFPKPLLERNDQVDVLMEALLPGQKRRQRDIDINPMEDIGDANTIASALGTNDSKSIVKADTRTDEYGRVKSFK